MKATTNIHKAETITGTASRFDDRDQANTAHRPRRYRPGRRDRPRASPRASLGPRLGGTAST